MTSARPASATTRFSGMITLPAGESHQKAVVPLLCRVLDLRAAHRSRTMHTVYCAPGLREVVPRVPSL